MGDRELGEDSHHHPTSVLERLLLAMRSLDAKAKSTFPNGKEIQNLAL